MEKEFSKIQIAQLKRTAQNVASSVKRKNKLEKQIIALSQEYKQTKEEIESWQAPIKAVFKGYTTEDLVDLVVVETGTTKDGKPVRTTKPVLKYPDTIVPPTVVESESETIAVDDNDSIAEESENTNINNNPFED